MSPARPDSGAALHAEAHAWATEWSQRWFAGPNGADRLRFDETDAGWATHVEAYLILLELAAATLGNRPRRRPTARGWLKARGYDRALRALALRRLSAQRPPHRPAALIIEIPTPSMSAPALAVAAAAPGAVTVAIADPRVARQGDGAASLVPLVLPWREERLAVHAASRKLATAWSAFTARPPEMRLRNHDVTAAAIALLAPLVGRSMPYLAAERIAIERLLDTQRPRAVAVASDQHRIGRLVVAAAHARGIQSVVLQHGLPQSEVGFLPVVADVVATWSEGSAAWFADHGTDPARLVVTGNPRLDRRRPAPMPGASTPHVLLALSPTAVSTNASLVRDATAATAARPDTRLTIKLHPGQSDWSFVAPLVAAARLGDRVAVRRHEPLAPLLEAATVVVVHRSSVAVEALAMDRPVVVHRAGDEPTTADLELKELGLAVTDDVSELVTTLARLSHPDAAADYLTSRRAAIERVTGPLDGGSAERIVRLLLAGAQ